MANYLGITVDELKLKLEEMGISEDSLTSLEGVRAAILELTGLTDATELVNLAGIKELFSKVDDILNMSTEDAIAMALENKGLTSVEELLEQANTLANEKLNSEDTKEVEQVVEQNTVKSNVETNTTKSDANIVDSEMVNQTTDTVDESTNNAVVSNAQETLAEETGAVNEVAEDVNLEGNKVLQVMEEINQEAVSAQAVQSTQAQSQMGQGQSGGNNQNANPNANNGAQDVMNNIMFTQDVKGQATTFSTIVNNRMNQNINQQEVINQIVEKMKVSVNGDTSEVSITLRPEHLGDVTLKIATHNGVVTAEFLAQSEEVKALIEANFQDLQETLRQKGIEVSNFTTGLLSDGQKETNSNNRRSRNNNRNIGGVETLEEEQVEELEEIKISNIDYSV